MQRAAGAARRLAFTSTTMTAAPPARLDGREGLAVLTCPQSVRAINFIELTVHQEQIARIRDFHHVPYFTMDARMSLTEESAT
jgi:hypothetical protein